MSYLFEETTPDELLLMIVASYKGRRPDPWPADDLDHLDDYRRREVEHARSIRTPTVGPGFCWLNRTENLQKCWNNGWIVESSYQGFVVHLTWKGWARVDELLASGMSVPLEGELKQYARETSAALNMLTGAGGNKKLYTPGTEAWYAQQPEDRPKPVRWKTIKRLLGRHLEAA